MSNFTEREPWLRAENERLREALKQIHHEVTNDIGGLPRDEALNIITWVAETADAALRQGKGDEK